MTEDLNNQDLFNLEDNEPDPFDGNEFPNLPPLNLTQPEDEMLDIESIPAKKTTEKPASKEKPMPEKKNKEKKERKGFALFKKSEKKEGASPAVKPQKVKKTKPAPREKTTTTTYSNTPLNLGPLFWSISGLVAMVTAFILLIVVIIFAVSAVNITRSINDDLIASLHNSFVAMDEAHITTTIPINDEVPAQFELQLDTVTTVTLSEDTYINDATVSLNTGGLSIYNAPTDIVLPAGSELPIHLVLTVPVDEMIPVVMDVDVDIPMSETQLHGPFSELQETIKPYYLWLNSLTNSEIKILPLPWNQ